jgi:ribosomal protein S27AE
MTYHYECPNTTCGALIEIDEHDDRVRCQSCHVLLELDTDADYYNERWHDFTRLIPVIR